MTGADYQIAQHTPSPSRVKVMALAMAMMVPTLIWTVSTFLLVTEVLQKGIIPGLIAASVAGGIILILETIIVKASGSFWIAFFRVALGLSAALIGSIIIDEIVFEADIDQQMEFVRTDEAANSGERAAAHFTKTHKMGDMQENLAEAERYYKTLDSLARGEADGSIGSGRRGVDVVTQMKQQQALMAKQDYENLLAQHTNQMQQMAEADSVARLKAETSFNSHSLLKRIKALYQLVSEDIAMFWVYAVFTFMMFMLEFLVIILKLCWPETALENESKAIEKLYKERTKRLYQPDSPLHDPAHIPHVAGMLSRMQHFNTLL